MPKWYRTCEECEKTDEYKFFGAGAFKYAEHKIKDSFRDVKCRHCGARSLDIGGERDPREEVQELYPEDN